MHITVWQCSEGIMHYIADLEGYAPQYSATLGKPEDGRVKSVPHARQIMPATAMFTGGARKAKATTTFTKPPTPSFH